MGVYGIVPEVSIYVKDFSQELILCFVFFTGLAKTVDHKELRFVVETAEGIEIKGDLNPMTLRLMQVPDQPSIFAFRFQGTVAKPGVYSISLVEQDEKVFRETLKIAAVADKGK